MSLNKKFGSKLKIFIFYFFLLKGITILNYVYGLLTNDPTDDRRNSSLGFNTALFIIIVFDYLYTCQTQKAAKKLEKSKSNK